MTIISENAYGKYIQCFCHNLRSSAEKVGFESKAFFARLQISSLDDSLDIRTSCLIPFAETISNVLSPTAIQEPLVYILSFYETSENAAAVHDSLKITEADEEDNKESSIWKL